MKPNYLRVISLLVLESVTLSAQVARQANVIPLKNWETPLYWQPNQTEREVASQAVLQKGGEQLVFSANQVSTSALTFIAITPCRLVDTRGGVFNGISPFSGPSIAPMTTVTFPVQSSAEASADTEPAPCGTIPAIAQAYSFNITVVPHGSGAVDYVSLWPSGYPQPYVSTLDDPQGAIVANAAIVPAGAPMGGISVFNFGPTTADVVIDMNGFYATATDLNSNTGIGFGALASNTTGINNTATGQGALSSNTTGIGNTASGLNALSSNTTGGGNTATGAAALASNTSGTENTAGGNFALGSNTIGGGNTATGSAALLHNTTGSANMATGQGALESNTTGNNNTASGGYSLENNTTACCNTATGFSALQLNTTGGGNTASGFDALENNTTACCNTATGMGALQSNTTGSENTASGFSALSGNTTGYQNTASGVEALLQNTTGVNNTAVGFSALYANTTGANNTASGGAALSSNTAGNNNTASGVSALINNTTGNSNIAIGYFAALNLTTGSNNIDIGNEGATGDGAAANRGVTRLGTVGFQTSTFIAGISGATPGTPNLPVCVDGNGQLGTTGCSTPSSRRFKDQITDMGDSSSGLLQLRPVTFLYKPEYDDGFHARQYGLIAEEVAKIYPDMVGYDKDGQPSSVKYQSLAPMLLNEVQKENAQLQKQNAQLQREVQIREEENRLQQEENRKLEDHLAALETLLSSQAATAARPASSQ